MPIPPPTTRRVLTTELACTDYNGLGEFLKSRAATGNLPAYAVDFTNTHIATMRRHDPTFARVTSSIDLFVPDGMPLIWCLNFKGAGLKDRIYGPTFMRVFLSSCPNHFSHFFIGGNEYCGKKLLSNLFAKNPIFNVVGAHHGICDSNGIMEGEKKLIAQIQDSKPDFIWVGLGAPKQYSFINNLKPLFSNTIFLAVGFAFDVNAGTKGDAPLWMQKNGLTWAYRVSKEPRRLFLRYLKWNTLFVYYTLCETFPKALKER
jgi:N-acetylglucosaminyldiphosphoundecaprenol N-acetyl-beta-D-mannosaminyltransferase